MLILVNYLQPYPLYEDWMETNRQADYGAYSTAASTSSVIQSESALHNL